MSPEPAVMALALRPARRVAVRSSKRTYTRVAVATVAAGVVTGSLVLPAGLLAILASLGVLGIFAARTGGAPLYRGLHALAVRRAHYARRLARQRKLPTPSIAYHTLLELTDLVDEIESTDRALAHRFDLEALLDRYVVLATALEQARRAASMVDRGYLVRSYENHRKNPNAHPRRRELVERRLRCLDDCEAKANAIENELGVIDDLIRLIAQRVACPDELLADDTIERQLAALQDDDEARHVIAAALR